MNLRILFIGLIVLVMLAVSGGLVFVVANSTGALDAWRLQVETANANARADELSASAADKEADARRLDAQGDLIIKQGQTDNATSNNRTTNFLMTVWGIVGPTAIPVTLFIGIGIGCVIGGSVMYAVGLHNEIKRRDTIVRSDSLPSPFDSKSD